jgi:hypothetical protein
MAVKEIMMKQIPVTTSWAGLDPLRVGKWGEQFVAMALLRSGFDVYVPAVDDRAIDMLVRMEGSSPRYIEMQVKTLRPPAGNYVFMRKKHFVISPSRYLALVMLHEGKAEPDLYFIPSRCWLDPQPPFSSRDYVGLKSQPEFGLAVNGKNMDQLQRFRFTGTSTFSELDEFVEAVPPSVTTPEHQGVVTERSASASCTDGSTAQMAGLA